MIACLGPENTYTDLAADKLNQEKVYFPTIAAVFEAVKSGKIALGIVPLENKIGGAIPETVHELAHKNVKIVRKISIPIHHCLIALPGAQVVDIKSIYSHEQAIKQTSNFLRKNFSQARIRNFPSTGAALEELIKKNDKSCAAIGPELAAKAHGLAVLAHDIENFNDNTTTFIVIEKIT